MTRNVSDDASNANKSSIADNDRFKMVDSETSPNSYKEVLWSLMKSTLDTYLSSLTQTLTNKTLTTPTIGSFANANHTHQNAAGGGTLNSAALATSPFPIQAAGASFNPSDATTYYLGAFPNGSPTTTAGRRRLYFPRTGTVTRADIFINFVAGSNEPSTMSFRLNDTTDTTLSAAIDLSSAPFVANVTGLSIAVAVGNYFEIKWVTPTWVTDPASVNISVQLLVT